MKKPNVHSLIGISLVFALVALSCTLLSNLPQTETGASASTQAPPARITVEAPTWPQITSTGPAAGPGAGGQVYYVHAGGGDAEQCTGLADAPYPGSGTANACAWSHPFWALDGEGQWKLHGGDALIIATGSYRMGIDAPNTAWCSAEYPWDCRLPPMPSGADANHPTQVLGAGWDQGCPSPPELWGAERASAILDLSNTSNAVIDCLEITDHSGCAADHCQDSVRCQRDTGPYGDYADQGLYAQDSAHITLRHLNIHGLGNGGVLAGRLADWTVEDVRIAANGMVGWNGDLGEDSSNAGNMIFRRLAVEWNGCPETYPGKQPANCWGQEVCGGYGDGFGEARSGGQSRLVNRKKSHTERFLRNDIVVYLPAELYKTTGK